MKNIFDDFTHCYPISKTLQFSLIPIGKTEEHIKSAGIIEEDRVRSEIYEQVKPLIDRCHRNYIDNRLTGVQFDWSELADMLDKRRKHIDYDEDELENIQQSLRKEIVKCFKEDRPKAEKIISRAKSGDLTAEGFNEDECKLISEFDRFSTYFSGFEQNRDNIYADDGSTSVAFRVVNENFPKFFSNCQQFKKLDSNVVKYLEENSKEICGGYSLSEIFDISFFNNLLSQTGIDFYNNLIGGFSTEGNKKMQGLNEFLNLAYQRKTLNEKIKFTVLFKQILSKSETLSFIPEQFLNDFEVKQAISIYANNLILTANANAEQMKFIFEAVNVNSQNIYIDTKQVPELSRLICGSWNTIKESLRAKATEKYGTKTKKDLAEIEKYVEKKSVYTLSEIQEVCDNDILNEIYNCYLTEYDAFRSKYQSSEMQLFLKSENKIDKYDEVKFLLDEVQKCEKLLKIFVAPDEAEKDMQFYSVFDTVYKDFRDNISVYNKTRNYASKKPFSTEKYKLNFKNPTLANGWDQNKEQANTAIILIKDNKYFLGIMNAKQKPKFKETGADNGSCYKKMVYKLLPGPNKMLPKVFFSDKNKEAFSPSEYILEGYAKGKHKKGENFDKKYCHDLIDYFKKSISEHPDWKKFGFVFSDTDTYEDISGFYKEIEKQNYKVKFSFIDTDEIEDAINSGKLYLFEIYNKDFSDKSTGKKNLHTLYWTQIFSAENLACPVIKLNGEAELFFRPASIENPFMHTKGSVLINKTDKSGNTVPDDIYIEATKDVQNSMSCDELSQKYTSLNFRNAPHNIIKDKRYAKDSFSFHVPITLNYNAENKHTKFNLSVLDTIKDNSDVNIIGIDRGERNLLYVSCIDCNGHIIEQRSLNVINGTDYHKKLDELEKQRDEARKNWQEIGKIKDMKEGYLSLAVHEVTEMMLRNNAIVVMEDLNFGFKRGRFAIEKQVYQKFEKMLIDKLNYLALKDKKAMEIGGICNAYQLTQQFESFKNLGKQSGFLFYIPAAYTSKIDYLTGFVNIFTSEQLNYSSVEKTKNFFSKFKDIYYNREKNCFVFCFKYSDFALNKHDYTDEWNVCTAGENRISFSKDKNGKAITKTVNVTEELKSLCEQNNIDYREDGLEEKLLSKNETEFYKTLLWLFKLTVQLRYEDSENDFILSPICHNGEFYDTRKKIEGRPYDGDANGAYHIALKGLQMLGRIENGKIIKDEKNMQSFNWFEFAQKKEFDF